MPDSHMYSTLTILYWTSEFHVCLCIRLEHLLQSDEEPNLETQGHDIFLWPRSWTAKKVVQLARLQHENSLELFYKALLCGLGSKNYLSTAWWPQHILHENIWHLSHWFKNPQTTRCALYSDINLVSISTPLKQLDSLNEQAPGSLSVSYETNQWLGIKSTPILY